MSNPIAKPPMEAFSVEDIVEAAKMSKEPSTQFFQFFGAASPLWQTRLSSSSSPTNLRSGRHLQAFCKSLTSRALYWSLLYFSILKIYSSFA
jgi:hypothetical protein